MQQKGTGREGARMALSKRMGIRQVLAAAVFAATTSIASPLYLAVISEQTASDAADRINHFISEGKAQ